MKAISRVLVALIAAVAALFATTGTSHAGLDNELSLVDGQDRTLTVQQWDTFLNGVFPLDRNRLTREWFHSGQAKYTVRRPRLPTSSTARWSWATRSASRGRWASASTSATPPRTSCSTMATSAATPARAQIITPNLFPGVSISADLGNGPGIQEVATFSVDVKGAAGGVAVSNAHGTVTGAAGGVLLRPFARLIASTGDSVTTYGEPWNMN